MENKIHSRQEKLKNEVEFLKIKVKEEGIYLKDIKFEDETLYFTYDNGNISQKEKFSFLLTDYPDGENMLFSELTGEPRVCKGNLVDIVMKIVEECNVKYEIKNNNEILEDDEDEELYDSKDIRISQEIWEQDYDKEISYKENPDLQIEIENYEKIFGKNSVEINPRPSLDIIEVETKIPYQDLLDQSVCNAWGINRNLPIIFKITFSLDYIYSIDLPKIECYQEKSQKTTFKLKYQLEGITKKFIDANWPSKTKKPIKPEIYTKTETTLIKKEDEKKSSNKFFNLFFHKDHSSSLENENLQQLLNMGFPLENSKKALKITNSVEEAINLLLSSPENILKEYENETNNNNIYSFPLDYNIPNLINEGFNKKMSGNQKYKIVSSKYGFLVMLATYLRERLPTLNDYCVICDEVHIFLISMLKPTVCTRDLCCFSYQQLGVASNFVDDIATGREVVDLLLSFATVAALSPRCTIIFEPFPLIFDPQNPQKTILNPKNKDFNLLKDILSSFPSIEKLSLCNNIHEMKKKLDLSHKFSFPLLQWIISSNRSHIVKLTNDALIEEMKTPHQYLLLSAPPEKESKFRELRNKFGSTFAFHGSSTENWHSILRCGLKNASGTKLQMNGAAFGAGIYLSPLSEVSFSYCRVNNVYQQDSNNRFLNKKNFICIAMCEVIDHDIRKNGSIWVQQNEDYVVTRFFFVYNNISTFVSCNTQEQKFRTSILSTINKFKL